MYFTNYEHRVKKSSETNEEFQTRKEKTDER